jgi:ketosteroid isomerase-like protein
MVLKFPELDTISVGSIKNDIRQPSQLRKGKRMKSKLRTDVITPAVAGGVREAIRRRLDPEEYRAIRRLWIAHSMAEDSHDIPGLMATLTEDCVYTVVNSGVSWNGKAGATQFYQHLLGAFPDIHFDLQNIVIGPQGVFEEAFVTGTYESQWLDMPSPDGRRIQFWVTILFPWNPGQKLFSGERIYFFMK